MGAILAITTVWKVRPFTFREVRRIAQHVSTRPEPGIFRFFAKKIVRMKNFFASRRDGPTEGQKNSPEQCGDCSGLNSLLRLRLRRPV